MRNSFEVRDPWVGACEPVRRSLTNIQVEHPSLLKLIRVVQSLKLRYKSPFWRNPEDGKPWATAHLLLEDYKTVIFTHHVRAIGRENNFRARWESHGYTVLTILRSVVQTLSDERLAADLSERLGLKRGKKK